MRKRVSTWYSIELREIVAPNGTRSFIKFSKYSSPKSELEFNYFFPTYIYIFSIKKIFKSWIWQFIFLKHYLFCNIESKNRLNHISLTKSTKRIVQKKMERKFSWKNGKYDKIIKVSKRDQSMEPTEIQIQKLPQQQVIIFRNYICREFIWSFKSSPKWQSSTILFQVRNYGKLISIKEIFECRNYICFDCRLIFL